MIPKIPTISLIALLIVVTPTFAQKGLEGFGVAVDIFKQRTWTSANGSKINAKLKRILKNEVVLEVERKDTLILIKNFSKPDRILIDKHQVNHSRPYEINFNSFRFWRNKDGKEIEAKILDASKSFVQIQVKDSKSFRLPITQLSPLDGKYVNKFLQSQNYLSDEQIFKRLTMYKWRNTPTGAWRYRIEFKTSKTGTGWYEATWVWFAGGSSSGSWKLEPNGIVKSTFGTWQFPVTDSTSKVLKGTRSDFPNLYGSTGFD